MATKQLHLDVAQLTDVGRKREHNEDNMAYVIPKDPQVMAKKGALFIVADGMGGHAAGEVASEIAVDTVSNVYYQNDSDDVAISLLHAIKRANALIHQRAAENMLRSGMGTTCVAAVLRGNMAYIANVGDSRAYLVRNGQVKQVSQDHSWVAEQVRAGLLTEDQARTHAQRNVITRCLGTQSDVEIDVFPEQIEEKDSLVLCTDGLSGLVSDEEIRRIVDQAGPQESVYHLVERANENGGPDNITAIVVSILEVGSEPPNVRHPVYVGGRENGEDTTAPLGLPASSSGAVAPALFGDAHSSSGPLRFVGGQGEPNTSGPLVSPDSITAPQPALPAPPRRSSRLLYPSLALLVLVVAALLAGGGGYFYTHINTNAGADQDVRGAQNALAKARGELAANPTAALHDLASAQTTLRTLQKGSLTNAQSAKVMGLLQHDLTTEVRAAITSYNAHAAITSLPCPGTLSHPLNLGTTGTQPKTLALVQSTGKSLLYTLGLDNKLYQVDANNSLLPLPAASPLANATILDIAGGGTQLVVLTAQTSTDKGIPMTSYTLGLLSPDQTRLDPSMAIDPALLKNGQLPKLISASDADIYVVLASGTQQSTTTTILDYPLAKGRQPFAQPQQSMISVSSSIVSLAAFPTHQLFFLLDNGSVQSLQFAPGNQEAPSVLVKPAIAQPLAVSATDYTWTMPVPLVTPGGSNALAVPGATAPRTLVVGLVNGVAHLFILDTSLHRVLDLAVASSQNGAIESTRTPGRGVIPTSTSTGGGVVSGTSPVTLQVVKQYSSPKLLAQARSMAVDGQNAQVKVVAQNSPSMPALISFSTMPQSGCA